MAKTGKTTATDASDFFSQLVTFLTGDSATPGRDWTIVRDDRPSADLVVLKNTGDSGNESIYIGFKKYVAGDNIYAGAEMKVYYEFVPPGDPAETDFYDTTYGNPGTLYVPFWNDNFSFWVWSNSQRIILVSETSGKYGNAYLGMVDRFVPPTEYQFPLIALSDSRPHWEYTRLTDRNNLIYTPSNNGRAVVTPGRDWTHDWQFIPTQGSRYFPENITNQDSRPCRGSTQTIYKDTEPKAVLPVYVKSFWDSSATILGQLDGVGYCPGTFFSVETVLDNNYVLFPNINRTEWYQWMAIKDE